MSNCTYGKLPVQSFSVNKVWDYFIKRGVNLIQKDTDDKLAKEGPREHRNFSQAVFEDYEK